MSKWINKRRQALTERVNKGTDRTEYDPGFVELEKQTDATKATVEKIVKVIPTYLHPNPAARTMKSMGTAMAKITKTAAEKRYPHSNGELAEIMLKGGAELDEESLFGSALLEVGEALNQICEAQHAFDAEVNQNVLDPLKGVLEKDVKEIMKHRKKLEGRRLDYDFKRRKMPTSQGKITDADIKISEQKMDESKALYECGMLHLLENDVEQVGQLAAFVEATLNMQRQSVDIMENVLRNLRSKLDSAGDRPRRERSVPTASYDDDDDDDDYGNDHSASKKSGSKSPGGSKEPCARALFDFEAENEGEISFREGDIIKLVSRLDENWLEGDVRGEIGIFPSNYVEVIVDVD